MPQHTNNYLITHVQLERGSDLPAVNFGEMSRAPRFDLAHPFFPHHLIMVKKERNLEPTIPIKHQ